MTKRTLLACSLLAIFSGGFVMQASGEEAAQQGKLLRHVVLFQFKDGTSPEQVKEVEDAFRALPKKIDAIVDFEWGTDVSVENRADGFTHCFFVSFRNEKGREEYLPHPAHKEFGQLVRPRLEKVLVVDYWSRD
ncbi:MAG: Dabb family protein [Planctomycetales bacterium]|nr:Dabb family protein [Planctomycetales bacterium]